MTTKTVSVLLLCSVLAGCSGHQAIQVTPVPLTVAQATADPHYIGHPIQLVGMAIAVFGLGSAGEFRLKDATGTIRVICTVAVPIEGERVRVAGVLHQVLVAGRERILVVSATGWSDAGLG